MPVSRTGGAVSVFFFANPPNWAGLLMNELTRSCCIVGRFHTEGALPRNRKKTCLFKPLSSRVMKGPLKDTPPQESVGGRGLAWFSAQVSGDRKQGQSVRKQWISIKSTRRQSLRPPLRLCWTAHCQRERRALPSGFSSRPGFVLHRQR